MNTFLSISDTIKTASYGGLTGSYPEGLFGWCMFFAILGFLFTTAMHVMTRDVHKDGTPVKFSWLVFFQKNWPRLTVLTIAMYAVVRFFPEFYGKPLTEHHAFMAGAGLDGFIILFKKLVKAFNKK